MQNFKNKKPYRLRLFIHYSINDYGFALSNSFLFSFTAEYESALLQTNSIEHQTLLIMPFSEPNDTCTCRLLRLILLFSVHILQRTCNKFYHAADFYRGRHLDYAVVFLYPIHKFKICTAKSVFSVAVAQKLQNSGILQNSVPRRLRVRIKKT